MSDVESTNATAVASTDRSRRVRRVRRWALTAVVLYLLSLIMLVSLETALVYPRPPVESGDWAPAGLVYEAVDFTAADGTALHGWFLEHPQPRATILFFHGNAEQVAYLGDEMDALRQRYAASVFVFDYRGYGKSEGTPNEAGVLLDGVAAQRWLAQRTNRKPDEIVLYGRSLGGAVAVANASTEGAALLVLDRTFHSMVEVAAGLHRWAPVRWLMRNRYPSSQRLAVYSGPLLQIHGIDDEFIPFASGKRLFEASPSQEKQFLAIDGLYHNDPIPPEFYLTLDSVMPRRESTSE